MAYMNQEKKNTIALALKRAIPAGWKYSLSVKHHSGIVLTIAAAPVDLLGQMQAVSAKRSWHSGREDYLSGCKHVSVNPYYWRESGLDVAVWEPIFAALNAGNHDRSDSQSDYFDVGWYVDVHIGRWDRPFIFLAQTEQAAA